ncbi:DUF6089 family protein [Neolewinella lacunae]|uniref:DUF6089 family protein n=1 Tax=Neolewinella lacunae TaxID=1517758 RepID=UPI0022287674|nr:DUF6089 family protein [Neolewinella lacunae]MDN3633556.1 DUF6089 family protein [Neolewinella lacunae]
MLTCLSLAAQDSQYPWEFGIRLGTSSIGGDMIENDIIFLNQPKFSAGLSLRRRLGTTFALRGSFDYGTLSSDDTKSDDASQVARGWKSEATILEPSLSLEFEPFAGKRFSNGTFKKILSPYISAGVGYGIWGEVDTDFNGASNAAIVQDQQENLDDKGGVVFPVGGGLKWYVSRKSSIGLDLAYRITGADLIDGVSQSGNPAKDDSYIFTGLTFATGFGKPDADKDGIFDEDDACPTEPGPASTMGCPDTDGDGVADKDDACPQVAGLATLMGCPDGDGDGVADKDDDCPTEAGVKALNGCPDGDGDGVADKDDECPTEAGVKALNGCPDGDGDGVADKDDDCPAEPGTKANRGCPDTDGDGIIDKEDECPTVAGVASRNGCPEPSERPENLQERIARYRALLDGQDFKHIRVDTVTGTIAIDRIYFPTDVSSLNRPDRVIIEEIDRFLELPGASEFSIRYEGHADRRASDEYNQALSERRAGSAEAYTAEKGAPAAKLSQIGFGENQPVGETLRENRVVIPVATEPTRMVSGN